MKSSSGPQVFSTAGTGRKSAPRDGQLCRRGGSKSYGEVAKEYEKACSRYLRAELEYEPPSNPGSYSKAFAEVKVDKYTGLVEVTDLLAVHDVGQCMNRTLAEGQVEGAHR